MAPYNWPSVFLVSAPVDMWSEVKVAQSHSTLCDPMGWFFYMSFYTSNIWKMNTQKMKKAFLILQYSILKSTVVQYNSWHTDAGSSAQARRATNWRRERRGEMVALKDHQQRRQRASCNFTHAWCWWHRFCFLAGFSSVLSCSWSGTSVMSSSLQLYGLYPASLLCSWDFPTKNLGVVVMPSSRGSSWLKDCSWWLC